jgi:Mg2+ and Co2+ transporter CorA
MHFCMRANLTVSAKSEGGGAMATIESLGGTNGRSAEVRRRIASRVAREVRLGGDATKLTKVTSLLHAFREAGTPPRFGEVREELQRQGLELTSGWELDSKLPDIRRTGVLELSSAHHAGLSGPVVDVDDRIQVSLWDGSGTVGEERPLETFDKPARGGVLWFNVDPPVRVDTPQKTASPGDRTKGKWFSRQTVNADTSSGAESVERVDGATRNAFQQRVSQVADQLRDWCPELTEEMVADLLREDSQPKVETYGDENDGVRGVSAVAVIARETRPPSGDDDTDGVSEELIFQMVEMIVGEGWIVTCWHPSRVYSGASSYRVGNPILREPFLSHVRQRWRKDSNEDQPGLCRKTSGDLGVYLARSLVDTYGASHRMMERWAEAWESIFYTSLTCSDKAARLKEAAGEISDLLSMVAEFSRRLTAFDHGRWSTVDKSWFPAVSDRDKRIVEPEKQSPQVDALAESIRSTKEKLALLSVHIRADLDLLMLQSTATQQESSEKLQDYLGKVTGLVLVPSLVVGLFGANTRLPGQGSWGGFELMLVLMLVSSIAVYLAIHKLTGDRRSKSNKRKQNRNVRHVRRAAKAGPPAAR